MPIEPLSSREHEVLILCAGGASNTDIATDLCIELKTVEYHLSTIYGKLHASNRTHALARAVFYGEISPFELSSIVDYVPPMARGSQGSN